MKESYTSKQTNNNNNQQGSEVKKPTRPVDYTNNNWCGYRGVWEVYPGEGWDTKRWGEAPFLGYVRADNEYWAKYAAYNKGYATPNVTFELKIIKARKFVANI